MDGKVLLKETKKNLRVVLEDAIKLGVVGELVDGPIIAGAINIVDHYGDKVIPDEYDPIINSACEKIIAKDYDGATVNLATIMNKLIDIPVLDEATEEVVFINGLRFLVSILQNYIQKKKNN